MRMRTSEVTRYCDLCGRKWHAPRGLMRQVLSTSVADGWTVLLYHFGVQSVRCPDCTLSCGAILSDQVAS